MIVLDRRGRKPTFGTPDCIKRMREMRLAGQSYQQIADAIGCSLYTVWHYAVYVVPEKQTIPLDEAGIMTAYKSGEKMDAITKKFGCCRASVYNTLQKNRVNTRKQTQHAKYRAVLADYVNRVPFSDMLTRHGTTRRDVFNILQWAAGQGLEIPRRGRV